MIKEAIEILTELYNGKILSANGRNYTRHTLSPLASPDSTIETLQLHTLSGLCEYIQKSIDSSVGRPSLVIVQSEKEVSVMSELFGEFRQRDVYLVAKPFLGSGFNYNCFQDPENFIIGLQSKFVQDENTAAILKVIGNIQSEASHSVLDDGVSQTVTARAGIARVANVAVPNPVILRPYRTFAEIEQPASRFILRTRDNDGDPEAALFETGDAVWKITAIELIKEHLKAGLGDRVVLA